MLSGLRDGSTTEEGPIGPCSRTTTYPGVLHLLSSLTDFCIILVVFCDNMLSFMRVLSPVQFFYGCAVHVCGCECVCVRLFRFPIWLFVSSSVFRWNVKLFNSVVMTVMIIVKVILICYVNCRV